MAEEKVPCRHPVPENRLQKIGHSIENGLRKKIEELNELIEIHEDSLNHQKKSAAMYAVPPSEIVIPIKQKEKQLADLSEQLAALQEKLATVSGGDYKSIVENYAGYLVEHAVEDTAMERANCRDVDGFIQSLAERAR